MSRIPSGNYCAWSADLDPAIDDVDNVDAIVKAKQGPDEARYLRLLQQDSRLRAAVLQLGS